LAFSLYRYVPDEELSAMTDEELDDLPLADEARLESSNKPALRRGAASLRGQNDPPTFASVLRILVLAPEERAELDPRNGFEEIAKALVDAPKKGKEGAVAIAAFREIKDTFGERIGSRWRDTLEHNQDRPVTINDMPRPEYKQPN
jgi:hypothetical protein